MCPNNGPIFKDDTRGSAFLDQDAFDSDGLDVVERTRVTGRAAQIESFNGCPVL